MSHVKRACTFARDDRDAAIPLKRQASGREGPKWGDRADGDRASSLKREQQQQHAHSLELALEAQLTKLLVRTAVSTGEQRAAAAACALLLGAGDGDGDDEGGVMQRPAPSVLAAEEEAFAAHFARLLDAEFGVADPPAPASPSANGAPSCPERSGSAADAGGRSPPLAPPSAARQMGASASAQPLVTESARELAREAARAALDATTLDGLCDKLYAELQQLHAHVQLRARTQLQAPDEYSALRRLFLAGLPLRVAQQAVVQALGGYGMVESCEVFVSPSARGADGEPLPLRIATVVMQSPLAASAALADLASGRLGIGGTRAPDLAAMLDEDAGTFTADALGAAVRASSALQAASNARARAAALSAAAVRANQLQPPAQPGPAHGGGRQADGRQAALGGPRACTGAGADEPRRGARDAAQQPEQAKPAASGGASARHGGGALGGRPEDWGGRRGPHSPQPPRVPSATQPDHGGVPASAAAGDSGRLFVSGLPAGADGEEVAAALCPFGPVLSATVLTHPARRCSLRIGTARMQGAEAAAAAVRAAAAGLVRLGGGGGGGGSADAGGVALSVALDARGAKADAAYAALVDEGGTRSRSRSPEPRRAEALPPHAGPHGGGGHGACGGACRGGGCSNGSASHSHAHGRGLTREHSRSLSPPRGQPPRRAQPPSGGGAGLPSPLQRPPSRGGSDGAQWSQPPAPRPARPAHKGTHASAGPKPPSRADLVALVSRIAEQSEGAAPPGAPGGSRAAWLAFLRARRGGGEGEVGVEPASQPTSMLAEFVRSLAPARADGSPPRERGREGGRERDREASHAFMPAGRSRSPPRAGSPGRGRHSDLPQPRPQAQPFGAKPAANSAMVRSDRICDNWRRGGKCRFNANCWFRHVQIDPEPSERARRPPSREREPPADWAYGGQRW